MHTVCEEEIKGEDLLPFKNYSRSLRGMIVF